MNVVKLGVAAEANWRSSITITTGSSSTARSFTITIATSPRSGSASESKSVRVEPAVGPPVSEQAAAERGPKGDGIGIAFVT